VEDVYILPKFALLNYLRGLPAPDPQRQETFPQGLLLLFAPTEAMALHWLERGPSKASQVQHPSPSLNVKETFS